MDLKSEKMAVRPKPMVPMLESERAKWVVKRPAIIRQQKKNARTDAFKLKKDERSLTINAMLLP